MQTKFNSTVRIRNYFSLILLSSGLFVTATLHAEKAEMMNHLTNVPIKEITVFKDGHAFVVHEGSLPVNSKGHLMIDSLPTPVLGTFWPYSLDKKAKLVGVVAGQQRVLVERSALSVIGTESA